MRRLVGALLFAAFLTWGTLAQTYTNVKLDDASVLPGSLITAQIIEIKVPTGQTLILQSVTVKNAVTDTATDHLVGGSELEYIEIRRGSATGSVLKKETDADNLAKFTNDEGVTINTTANNSFSAGTHRLYILVKLKHTEGLVGKKLSLGGTEVTPSGGTVSYPSSAPAATFTVVGPSVSFKALDVSDVVYRGQRFLAARISVNATDLPFDSTVTRLTVKNGAADGTALGGKYVTRIEVRRAADNALLGEQTSATELEKFATAGTSVNLTANNEVKAYSQVELEIWITLAANAPLGHKIKVSASVRYADTDFTVEGQEKVTTFTVSAEAGLETAENVGLGFTERGVVPGQTFLAQRIKLGDSDDDPYDVALGSILVTNTPGENPLAEQHVSEIVVKRRADGAVLGSTTNLSGLNTTGVRISLTSNNTIPDDTEVELELYVTLKETAPPDRKLNLTSQVWYSEGGATLSTDPIPGSATFTVVEPQGLETVANKTTAPADKKVYPNQSFLAQKIYLEDKDDDSYGVTIARILVKNLSSGTLVEAQHVAKIEVRDSSGKLLGETTNLSGLTTSGVWVSTTANNTIADNKNLTVEIWVTLKGDVPAGRKFTAGARVEHTEGGKTFVEPDDFLPSGVEFTTATDGGRTVNFTYTPEKPKWNEEVTFTPTVSPNTDIVYARWEFGDGQVVERRVAEGEKPLDPIKHTYKKGGEFTVTYAVRDNANRENRVSKKITVTNEPPKNVDFSFSPSAPTTTQNVTFTPSDKIVDPDGDIKKATFRWDFGDGTDPATTTGPKPVTHTYTRAGTFTVTLTVTDEGGASSAAKKEVRVSEPTPPPPEEPEVTGINWSPEQPEAGKEVTFTATTKAPQNDPATAWEWDFGDGSTQTTDKNSVTHTYANPGQYTVRVRARNNAGWSTYFSRQITVYPPGVTFGALVLDNPVTGNQCRIQIFAPAGATDLKITILDQAGRPVLLDKSVTVGLFTWDLRDREGRVVPNGLYLFYVTARVGGETRRTEIGRILVRR